MSFARFLSGRFAFASAAVEGRDMWPSVMRYREANKHVLSPEEAAAVGTCRALRDGEEARIVELAEDSILRSSHHFVVVGDLYVQLVEPQRIRTLTLGQTIWVGGMYRGKGRNGSDDYLPGLPKELTRGHIVGFDPKETLAILYVMLGPHDGMPWSHQINRVDPRDVLTAYDMI